MNQNFRLFYFLLFAFVILQSCKSDNKIIWQIGQTGNGAMEFALFPDQFESYIESDFGWEDRYYSVSYTHLTLPTNREV